MAVFQRLRSVSRHVSGRTFPLALSTAAARLECGGKAAFARNGAAAAAAAAAVAATLLTLSQSQNSATVRCDSAKTSEVRFTTYNVLAPLLCNAKHFPQCPPDELPPESRFPKVVARLESEISEGAVIALQEVDLLWAGKLHAFFAERGYAAVFAQYGRTFNGYMGVMVAWPTKRYEALDVEISRIADTAPEGTWPKQPRDATSNTLSNFGILTYNGLKDVLGCAPPDVINDPNFEWRTARQRANEAVFVRLRPRGDASSPSFCVGTYHMPCMFGSPEKVRVVNIHTYLLLRRLKVFAGNDAAVLMGDFNFKPYDSPYTLATSGGSFSAARTINAAEVQGLEERLIGKDGQPWSSGLKSAYCAFHGKEPLFTNFAQTVGNKEPFVETLDYIWFTDGPLKVVDCPKLPQSRAEVQGPFPNKTEASDHVALTATMKLTRAPVAP